MVNTANNPIVASLDEIENETSTARGLAFARLRWHDAHQQTLAKKWQPLLQKIFDDWFRLVKRGNSLRDGLLRQCHETTQLRRLLKILVRISEIDLTLEEEIGCEGGHFLLSRLIKFDTFGSLDREEDQDDAVELQDEACAIASRNPRFPLRVLSFSPDEVEKRLPLTFSIEWRPGAASEVKSKDATSDESHEDTILIRQVSDQQSEQKDVGFVMWPSAVAMSRWVCDNTDELFGKSILELGSGCGLVGLVAARIMAFEMAGNDVSSMPKSHVSMTDFNEKVLENCKMNIALNEVQTVASVHGLDFNQQRSDRPGWMDMGGTAHGCVDLVLGADIICQVSDAIAVARTLHACLHSQGTAVIICANSKHRFGIDKFEQACKDEKLQVEVSDWKFDEHQHLRDSLNKTTGFVDEMTLLCFQIRKG